MHRDNPPLFQETPASFRLQDVEIRLALPQERQRWDDLVDQHHYLGFKRFAGRGLRYVFQWQDEWIGLAGWQSGAFKCRPRDRWVGWTGKVQFRRLHLLGNNTRFLLLGAPGTFPNLASHALAAMTRRLSADWEAAWGHPLLVAEAFVNPAHFAGHMYQAAGWQHLGRTKGFARASGRYTDPHGQPKDLYVQPLRRDAQRRLRAPDPLPDRFAAHPGGGACSRRPHELRSLYEELQAVPDFRRAQGRKHTIASVLTIYLLARLAGLHGGLAAADYAKSLSQDELQAVGAWQNPNTQRYAPPSKSVLYRVLTQADPEALEAVLRRYAMPRLQIGAAVAADGKRIRGANRNGSDRNETVTLVVHGTGLPLASLGFHDENGEIAAVQSLLETVPLHGRVVTIDALHTVRNTARLIVETHAAHYLMTVKANAEKTYATLASLDWDQFATGGHVDPEEKAHGRIERRRIQTLTPPPGTVNYPHLQQIFRIQRERRSVKTSQASQETVYGITSVPASQASPQQLLAWNRGHWTVENQNHRSRDVHFDEDACLARTGHAPVNNALCNCLAIAVLLHSGRSIAEGKRHFHLHRKDAFQAVLGAR